jgi:hypothetical protein
MGIFSVFSKKKPGFDSSNFVVLEIRVTKSTEMFKSSELQSAPISAEQMFAALHGLLKLDASIQEHLSFEMVSDKGGIKFYVALPEALVSFVESQIYSQYPDSQIRKVDDYAIVPLLSEKNLHIKSTYLTLTKPEYFPIKTFIDFEVDPLSAITGSLTDVTKDVSSVWMQILIRPIADIWQAEGYAQVDMMREGLKPISLTGKDVMHGIVGELMGTLSNLPGHAFNPVGKAEEAAHAAKAAPGGGVKLTAGQEIQIKAIEEKLTKLGFSTCIRIVVMGAQEDLVDNRMRGVLASFKQFSTANLNSFEGVNSIDDSIELLKTYENRSFSEVHASVLNTEELASIYHLPSSSVETPTINWVYAKTSEPPSDLPTVGEDITIMGETSFRENKVSFGIKQEDRRRHVYAIGKTGVGKSTLFRNMAVQDIYAGRGVAFLDPHGEEIDFLLSIIPEERLKDVVLFDPSDQGMPVALNPLECPDFNQKNLMASGIVEVFKKQFGFSWGPRLEYLLNYAVLTLIEVPGTTLLGVTRLLADTNYQKYIVHQINDPVIRDFWENEYKEKKGNQRFISEALDPIQNKVGRFLASPTIRNILGQRKSTIKLDEIMDNGKILLVNLAKGKIGEDNANLLGAMIVSRLSFMAMQRVKMREEDRRDFYLYVDEFQNFASDSFANILSEARKYRLNLNITHQYTAQLPEEMQDAVFGNVGTTISFALGAPDAKILSPEYEPYFDANDLITLERHNMYIKMMVNGMTSKPFSAKTYASPDEKKTNIADKVIEYSRNTYGTDVKIVDEKIRRWVEMPFDYGMAIAEEKRKKSVEQVEEQVKPAIDVSGELKVIDNNPEINGTIKIERQ